MNRESELFPGAPKRSKTVADAFAIINTDGKNKARKKAAKEFLAKRLEDVQIARGRTPSLEKDLAVIDKEVTKLVEPWLFKLLNKSKRQACSLVDWLQGKQLPIILKNNRLAYFSKLSSTYIMTNISEKDLEEYVFESENILYRLEVRSGRVTIVSCFNWSAPL